MKRGLLFFFIVWLSACGWHLRGYQSTEETGSVAVISLSLSADDIYTPLYRSFKNDYEVRRIHIEKTETSPELKLLSESVSTRILSLNTELDPAESEVTYKVNYQITLHGQEPQLSNVQLYRSYTQNKSLVSARDNEQQKLIIEMRHEAAEKVLNQLHTLLNSSLTHAPQ